MRSLVPLSLGRSLPLKVLTIFAAGLILLPIALWLVSSQLTNTNIFCCHDWGLVGYLHGTVDRPYAYRVLTVWLIRLVLALGLEHLPLPGIDMVANGPYALMQQIHAAAPKQITAYVIVATMFAVGFLATTYVTAIRFFKSAFWGVAAVILATLAVNSLMLQLSSHIYDFTVLFFSAVLFLLADRQQDRQFLAVFALACLAKETLGLFIIIFALIGYGARPLRTVVRNALVQGLIFLLVYGFEKERFADNGGSAMYHDFTNHFRYIRDNCTPAALLALLFFLNMLFYRFSEKPHTLRRSLAILPLFLLLYVVGGSPGEFRIIYDIFPVILLPVIDSCRRLTMTPTYEGTTA
jgi:hypothetical protein